MPPIAPKVATSLFDLTSGIPVVLPSDADIEAEDAPQKERKALQSVKEAADNLCQRMKFLTTESKLEAARHIARGVNSTSKMFNCAVFLRDKDGNEVPETPDLFEKQTRELDLFE